MNAYIEVAVKAAQREVSEEKNPPSKPEEIRVGKYGVTRQEINANIVEVGQIKGR